MLLSKRLLKIIQMIFQINLLIHVHLHWNESNTFHLMHLKTSDKHENTLHLLVLVHI